MKAARNAKTGKAAPRRNPVLTPSRRDLAETLARRFESLWQISENALAKPPGAQAHDGGAAAEEARTQAFGLIQGFRDTLRLAAQNTPAKPQAGTTAGIAGDVLEQAGIAASAIDLIDEITQASTRLGISADGLLIAASRRMELHAYAYRTALGDDLAGDDLAHRVAGILINPPRHIVQPLGGALFDADQFRAFGIALENRDPVLDRVPALRLIAPFLRSARSLLDYVRPASPLAALARSSRADLAAGGTRREVAMARIATGSLVMALLAEMTAAGEISGGGPRNAAMRAHLKATGWRPYALRINNAWHSYNRAKPVGRMLGLAADTAEIIGQLYDPQDSDVTPDEMAATAALALSKTIARRDRLGSILDLITALDDRRGKKLFAGPGEGADEDPGHGGRDVSPAFDVWQAQLDRATARLPGYGDGRLSRANLWGEPVVLGGGLGADMVSPLYSSAAAAKPSPADDELRRLGTPVALPGRVLHGVMLNAREHLRFVQLAGNEVKDAASDLGFKDSVAALVAGTHPLSPLYGRMADRDKSLVLRRLALDFRTAAGARLMAEFPTLRDLAKAPPVEPAADALLPTPAIPER